MSIRKFRIEYTRPCLGTNPSDPEIHKNFIASKASDALTMEEEVDRFGVDEMTDRGTTIFERGESGELFQSAHMLKGFFKAAGKACKSAKRSGRLIYPVSAALKAYRQEIATKIEVYPDRLYLHLPEGTRPGDLQRSLRAQTAQGERVALAHSESVPAGTWFECYVDCLDDSLDKAVDEWFTYGRRQGLGQWRNARFGTFKVTELEKVEELPDEIIDGTYDEGSFDEVFAE